MRDKYCPAAVMKILKNPLKKPFKKHRQRQTAVW
jgi:hypothetical protein